MFKDILLPVVLGKVPESAARHACALAQLDEGRVTALVAVSLFVPTTTTWAYSPVGTYETMDEAARAALRQQVQKVEQRLESESISHGVRGSSEFWLTPSEVTVMHAPYADIIVLGVDRPLPNEQRQLFAGVLVGSGRPMLLVPAASTTEKFAHVVIAWKSSREAARAVHDAMPLLQRAALVHLLLVEPETGSVSQGDDPAEWLASHMARHGVVVEVVRRARSRASTGQAIIDHAHECRADLIVAGGYSHARALEQVIGGVTRYLLEHTPVPVLFSH